MPERSLPLAGGRRLRLDRPLVMGILNVTPDSFSDGGLLPTPPVVAARAQEMVAQGADLLDVGGESTRPGHAEVSVEEELRRVVPAVKAIRTVLPDAVVSVDTRKATVARAALVAGAGLVNDVSGLGDPEMAGVVREAGCSIVLMRNRDLPGDVVEACRRELGEILARSRAAGIPGSAVILDPGLGFGDPPGGDPAANLALLHGVAAYSHGRPVLVGASRKRFIGRLTGVEKASERVAGSVAATLLAVQAGAAIVRVHDVAETAQALRVWRASSA